MLQHRSHVTWQCIWCTVYGTLAHIQTHLQVQKLLPNGKVESSEIKQDDSGVLAIFYMTSPLTFVCPPSPSLSNHIFVNISLCSLTNIILAYFSQLITYVVLPCMAIPSAFTIYKELKKKSNKHTDDRNFTLTSPITWVTNGIHQTSSYQPLAFKHLSHCGTNACII